MGVSTLKVFSAFKSEMANDMSEAIAAMERELNRYGCQMIGANNVGSPSRGILGYTQTVTIMWTGDPSSIASTYTYTTGLSRG